MENVQTDPPRRAGGRALSLRITVWILIGAAILNVPLTVHFLLRFKWTHKSDSGVGGAAAAARGWPVSTPHERAWPDPTNVAMEHHVGRTLTEAWVMDAPPQRMARVTFKIVDSRYGWPLACLKRTQFWWPDNQEWRINSDWDTGVRLDWRGALLNPVIIAAGAWVVLFAPAAAWRVIAAWRRGRTGRCRRCGYPIGASPVCTECGRAVGV